MLEETRRFRIKPKLWFALRCPASRSVQHPSSDLPRIKSGVGHLLPQGEKGERTSPMPRPVSGLAIVLRGSLRSRLRMRESGSSGSGARSPCLSSIYTWRSFRAPPASVVPVGKPTQLSRSPWARCPPGLPEKRAAGFPATQHPGTFMPAAGRRPVGTPSETWEPNPCREVAAALPAPGPEPVPARAMGAIMDEAESVWK